MSSKQNIIEFEGVEFKCFSLIEFSSLIELLKLLTKKYKLVDDKINILDERMLEKDKRISELEIMLKGVSQSTENKYPSISDKDKEKKEEEIDEKNLDNNINNINITEEKKFENENKDNILNHKKEETDSNLNNSQNQLNEEKAENIDDNKHDNENLDEKEKEKEHFIEMNQVPSMNLGLNTYNQGINLDNLQDILDKNNGEANKELFGKILKKLKYHEKLINDLSSRNNEFLLINKNIKVNKNELEELEKQIRNLKNNITDINRKMLGYNDDLEKIKVKVTDFDVYDLFKGGEGDVDLDAAKILIKTLENKMTKKFEIYDDRNKQIDKDVFKLQEEVKNSLAIIDGMKNKTDKNAEYLEELNQNYQNKMSEVDNIISEIQRQIEIINNKINSKPDYTNIKKDYEKKIKDLEEKLNSKLDLFLNTDNNKNDENSDEKNNMAKNEILSLIKELRKRIGELEKFTSVNFEKINADDIKKRISKLESEIVQKAGKYETHELGDKIRSLDEFVKDLNFKQDSLQQFTEKVRMDLAQIIKKIEFLSGEYSKLAFNKSGTDNENGLNNLDMSRFLDINIFNENKKDINNKFEKVRLGFEDLSREIEEILSKLSHTPTDKDFSEFQNIIKNLIDELKLSSSKKYADKIETSKNIKFLETQIKALHDAYLKKNEAGDNWLLAKKPINNFVCASCEANIKGELDKRTEFVPWNRYPQRDDKAYRIGHGFSRMLQMVNEDIIKNAGEKGGYSSDEDNKKNIIRNNSNNNPINTSVKLPKVTRKKPLLNGTAVTEPNNMNMNSISPYDDAENDNNDSNKIQIMRVVRKNKNQNEANNRDNTYSSFVSKKNNQNNDVTDNINNENEN